MPENSETKAVKKILHENARKDFVRRILYPGQSPRLQNNDGTVSSHSMAWGTGENGKAYVYPTVISNGNGQLVRLEDDKAWQHAANTGEFIEFPSAAVANWFSKKYKRAWGE